MSRMVDEAQTSLFSVITATGEAITGVMSADQLVSSGKTKETVKKPAPKPRKPKPQPQMDADGGAWSVSSLTQLLRDAWETHPVLGQSVVVRGELSNVNPSSRGHVYCSLKDDSASLRGVLWASRAERLPFDLHDGLEVFATGKIEVYAAGGSYSLVIDRIEPVGMGALQLAFEQLKAKLTDEGLFDADRKQPIPDMPARIGIVTAKTGAVIYDMLRVIRRKCPQVSVLLAPVPVQGAGAAEAIAAAITELNNSAYNLDLLIVGRGGGSLEDLFCFSEEPVVRAIAASRVPIIAGVGHEPDFSLADAAADMTCSTPTAAAEAAVPDTIQLYANLTAATQWLGRGLTHSLTSAEQQLDRATERLVNGIEQTMAQSEQAIQRLTHRLETVGETLLTPYEHQIAGLSEALNALSPLTTLQRGYWALTTSENGVISDITQLQTGQTIQLLSHTGSAHATVTDVSPRPPFQTPSSQENPDHA